MIIETPVARCESLDNGTSRIKIYVTVDGHEYEIVHCSGPKYDVEDYFIGVMTLEELQKKWKY